MILTHILPVYICKMQDHLVNKIYIVYDCRYTLIEFFFHVYCFGFYLINTCRCIVPQYTNVHI